MSEDGTKENDVQPAGIPEGTVIETPEDQPDEVVVHDRDEKGNVIGWHKEVVNG